MTGILNKIMVTEVVSVSYPNCKGSLGVEFDPTIDEC